MKRYSLLPVPVQWVLAIVLLILLVTAYVAIFIIIWKNPLFFWLLIFGSPLFYFFTTPFLALIGKYEYYSDVLFGYRTGNEIEIHLDTSFDYIVTIFPGCIKGQTIRAQVKKAFIIGNLNLIKKIEKNEIENNLVISATSHLINKKTFEIYKSKPVKLSFLQKIDYYWYTIDLLWMYIFSCGFRKIGRIFKVQKVQIEAGSHCSSKSFFQNALNKIETQSEARFTISHYQH